MKTNSTIKIGLLGAASIAHDGVVCPAREVAGVELHAVAARDPSRADSYAREHSIPVVHQSYEALLADPAIDAIYNPLPNGLHGYWSIRALEAGKHVLCEKPLAANANEARLMAETAARCGRVLMEALHYRFHPMADRMADAVRQLGPIKRIEASMCAPIPNFKDIRYNFDLAGGAAMDMGVYPLSLMRFLAAASGQPALQNEPELVAVGAKLRGENIDRAMKVDLRWGDSVSGRAHFSLWSSTVLKLSARVIGEVGELRVRNPYLPHMFNQFDLRLKSQKRIKEKVAGETSYTCQLREFLRRINGESAQGGSDLPDSIATMALIDAIYDKAGLPRRAPSMGLHK